MSNQFISVQWDKDDTNDNNSAHESNNEVKEEDSSEETNSVLITPTMILGSTNEVTNKSNNEDNNDNINDNDNGGSGSHSNTNDNINDDINDDINDNIHGDASKTINEHENEGTDEHVNEGTDEHVKEHMMANDNKYKNKDTAINADVPHFIEVKVCNPTTEYDGTNPYTSYEIDIKSNNSRFKETQFKTFRRYSDFHFLCKCLNSDFPTLLIPPLPNKQRLEYIKGGRFTKEFTIKRCNSLNNFLNRVLKHPILKNSDILLIFLENNDYWKTYKSNLNINENGSSGVSNGNGNNTSTEVHNQNLESVTDFIMNSFKKPTIESKYKNDFREILNQSNKLEENLNKIDRIYSKVVNKQEDISNDLNLFSNEFLKLKILVNNDFNGNHRSETEVESETKKIVNDFKKFSDNLKKISENLNNLNNYIEYNYLNGLKDLDHYLLQLNQLIKLKDSKILDYEMLNNYLEKSIEEKNYLLNGGSIINSTEGTISFLTKKFENLTGFGSNSSSENEIENLRNDRILKLNARIELLQHEKENAKKIFEKFEIDLLKEYKLFKSIKDSEINESLSDLNKSYIDFYSNLLKSWKNFDIGSPNDDGGNHNANKLFENKLSKENNNYFQSNIVLKNNELLQESIKDLNI